MFIVFPHFLEDSNFYVQGCQLYYQFSSSPLQIWQHAFVRFLIPPEEHLLNPKQNYHTLELDTTEHFKLSLLRLGDRGFA